MSTLQNRRRVKPAVGSNSTLPVLKAGFLTPYIDTRGVEVEVYGTKKLTAASLIGAATRFVPVEGRFLLPNGLGISADIRRLSDNVMQLPGFS